MRPIDLLLVFLAFYPVVTGAAWMAGGVIFRLLEEKPAPPPRPADGPP
ncbi:hypothetical protein NEH16_14970 [Streptomyces drozdowiczii]|uniref:Uncharacterized protein n=1 Tax=Streptomyces drozdowiczii TaxID=202862 RepID=A0ABY6PTG9_9ACTN|nr:hypothetical protein [Streptomyces drozdowiczii]UZK55259.1 hypothetical protein NEH16_14970 [Streptomyces drozdowiczii]